MFVYAALLATAAGVAPAFAARVYVPVLGGTAADGSNLRTQVWVGNEAKASRVASTAQAGRLVPVDAAAGDVYAWLNDARLTRVPVIDLAETFHAGAQPGVSAFEKVAYDRLSVGAANVGERAASCRATLYDAAHGVLADIPFEVAAKSLYQEDAAAWTKARPAAVEVSCDQEFMPISTATTASGGTFIEKGIGPNGPCNEKLVPTKISEGVYEVRLDGVFHQASLADPKHVLCVRAPADLNGATWRVGKAIVDWDFLVGPWWSKKPEGIHNIGYFFGERYRSGVIGNFNGLGPGKSLIKNMQNYGMPRFQNTNVKAAYALEKTLYHANYTFDANNKRAHTELQNSSRAVLKTLDQNTSPGGQPLSLTKYSSAGVNDMMLIAEFGNYNKNVPGHPEVPTPGWVYGNLVIRFFNK
jgi:hypothetical protein